MKKLLVALLLLWSVASSAQQGYKPTAENLLNRQEFEAQRFGMFIHWGLYSQLGSGEWVMHDWKIKHDLYIKLASTFNPTQFNAEEWVLLAKKAGMKYITITTKHHDGFCLWDSKATDFDVMDATPFKRDIIKEMAAACQKHGIKLCLYYSLLDWKHPDYSVKGNHGKLGFMGARANGDFSRYVDYMCKQLTELLTNYGPIQTIWFDGEWESLDAPWNFDKIYTTIHAAQPATLIGNNHHRNVRPGEDFQMFEKDLPGANSHGWVENAAQVAAVPLESCETMNGSWGYRLTDTKFKSAKNLTKYLSEAAMSNANFLLNVGPMPNGQIQREFQDTLVKIGSWLNTNGYAIYGTKGGIRRSWGGTTQNGNEVFIHLYKPEDDRVFIPLEGRKPVALKDQNGQSIKYLAAPDGVTIMLDKKQVVPSILKLTVK